MSHLFRKICKKLRITNVKFVCLSQLEVDAKIKEEEYNPELRWEDEVEDEQVTYMLHFMRQNYAFKEEDFEGGDASIPRIPVPVGEEAGDDVVAAVNAKSGRTQPRRGSKKGKEREGREALPCGGKKRVRTTVECEDVIDVEDG